MARNLDEILLDIVSLDSTGKFESTVRNHCIALAAELDDLIDRKVDEAVNMALKIKGGGEEGGDVTDLTRI